MYGLLQLVIALLRYKGRLTYAALQHEFGLDDATLDAIRHELIFAERVATDEAGRAAALSRGGATRQRRPGQRIGGQLL